MVDQKIDEKAKQDVEKTNRKKLEKKSPKDNKKQVKLDMKNIDIDENKRFTGNCTYFNRRGGYGFVSIKEKVVPGDTCMVYWKEIQTDDRAAYLYKGLEVEMNLTKSTDGVRGVNVTLPGGEKVNIHEEQEQKMELIGGKDARYEGTVEWYNFKKAIGVVKLKAGYKFDSDVPDTFKVDRHEIHSIDDNPRLMDGMNVRFGIQKNSKGKFSVRAVTNLDGSDISRVIVEERKIIGGEFTGVIDFWNRNKGFGFIEFDNFDDLPEEVQKIAQKNADATKAKKGEDVDVKPLVWFRRADRAERDARIAKDVKVKCSVYIDKEGCGACDVTCC